MSLIGFEFLLGKSSLPLDFWFLQFFGKEAVAEFAHTLEQRSE